MQINLMKVIGIENWQMNLDKYIKAAKILSQELKKDKNYRKYIVKTFHLVKECSLSDNFYGYSLDLFLTETNEEWEKNLGLIAFSFSTCEIIKTNYPSLYNEELEKDLKNVTTLENFDKKLIEIFTEGKADDEFVANELEKRINIFITETFQNLIKEYFLSILVPKFENFEHEHLLIDIPDKYIKDDVEVIFQNINLLYKLEGSFFEQSEFCSNIFELKKTFEMKKDLFLSKIDFKKYLDNNFFEKEIIKSSKNTDISKHIFNEKVSKVKVNKILKDMKLVEDILEISIFDWNIIENLDYKVFYNLFNLLYLNNSYFSAINYINTSELFKKNDVQSLIATLLHIKPHQSLYLEGHLSWIKDITFFDFSMIDDLKKLLKQVETIKDKEEYKKAFDSLMQKILPNQKHKFNNLEEVLENMENSCYIINNLNKLKSIVSKKINSKGFPLGSLGIENELDHELEVYDRAFILFNKDNLCLLPEKLSLVSEKGVAVFAVPESFLKDDSYKKIREEISLKKRIKSLIRLTKLNSESNFYSNENYYLILIKNNEEKITLADEIMFEMNVQTLKTLSYKKITDLVQSSNLESTFQSIDKDELITIDLESTPFSSENNQFIEDTLKGIQELGTLTI
ncbi:MAG: hypothetical protein ACRCZR_08140 [Cetobacterium sp.]